MALVDRIRTTPVFMALSIDEFFRVAEVGLEIRHQAGREISVPGQPPDEVFFLLEGALGARSDSGPEKELSAPAVVNVEEVLQGIPLRNTIRAIEHTIGFRVPAPVFLTMVSDNVLMAQGLFRLLLGESPYRLREGAIATRLDGGSGSHSLPPRSRCCQRRRLRSCSLCVPRHPTCRSRPEASCSTSIPSCGVPDSRRRSAPGIARPAPDSPAEGDDVRCCGHARGHAVGLEGGRSDERPRVTPRPRRSVRCDGRSR